MYFSFVKYGTIMRAIRRFAAVKQCTRPPLACPTGAAIMKRQLVNDIDIGIKFSVSFISFYIEYTNN